MDNRIAEESIFSFNSNNERGRKYTEIERLGKTHWQSDYARDIFKTMQEQEQRRRPLQFLSTQMDERQETIQLLQAVTRTCKLSRCAVHLAIYYLDRFADQYKIRPDKFPLVGLICLHIAAQIENADAFIPRYSEMNRFVKDAYTATEYKVVERKILCFFNFEMMRPTTASFVELFACSFLTRTDYLDYIRMLDDYERNHNIVPYQRYGSFEHMLATLAQLLLRLANCTLSIATYGNVPPSLLAAACIAAVRQVNGVKRWSQYLIDLTTYTEADVESYTETITMYYYYQITPGQVVTVAEEEQEELAICDNASGQSNPNWSSPESGFEEPLTAHTGFKEPLPAHTGFKEPSTAHTGFKEPLPAHTGFKEPLTVGTDFKEPSTAHTGFKKPSTANTGFKEPEPASTGFKEPKTASTDFKEPLTLTKKFVVLDNGITLEVETYSIISVQLQEPDCPTTPAPTSTMPYHDPEATLKRRCQEDDIEDGVPQPYKQPKLVTKHKD